MRRPANYRITVEVSAHNPKPDAWGNWTVREGGLIHQGRQSLEEPFEIGLYLQRNEHKRGPRHHRIKRWTLPGDGKKRTFSFETWIDNPWSSWIGWENGPWFRHNAWHVLLEQWYPKEYEQIDRKQKDFKKEVAAVLFKKGYLGPTLRVHSYRIEPMPQEWPPKSHTALYGKGPIEDADAQKLFHAFAERAYRRRSHPGRWTFVELAERLVANGNSKQEAMKGAYSAILCSPDFLYLRQNPGKLDDFALASRLSYFLWSSMPDDALMKLARTGKLSNPAELRHQTERMLNDPKSAAFGRHFPERWLKLHELGRMEPDKRGPFGHYFRVKDFLIPQVDAFFSDLLQNNGPIRNFIDSDYTFMNKLLGELIYKQKVVGEHFKVSWRIPSGGLLTMPAVMTVTANGVDTSPIVVGYTCWKTSSALPSPPPPAWNRSRLTCAGEILKGNWRSTATRSVHELPQEIDPMGLLEASIRRRWRDHYPKVDKTDMLRSIRSQCWPTDAKSRSPSSKPC